MPSQTKSLKCPRPPTASSTHSRSSSPTISVGTTNIESCLQDAVQQYWSGSTSLRRMAAKCHVPYMTLRNRVQGISNRREAHEHQQLLDNMQERVLVDWCEYHARMAIPLSRVQVAEKASKLTGRVPGKHWVERFLKKHESLLHSAKGHGLDPKPLIHLVSPIIFPSSNLLSTRSKSHLAIYITGMRRASNLAGGVKGSALTISSVVSTATGM